MILINLTKDVSFELKGFTEQELYSIKMAAELTARILFPQNEFPPLKSNIITIERQRAVSQPLYASGTPNELIYITSGENYPYQFAYQLAHELGHLTARADTRFPRKDGNLWIEEAICGAYSVFAIRTMSEMDTPLKMGAEEYVKTGLTSYSFDEVRPEWFACHIAEFRAAESLTDDLQKLSGYVANHVSLSEIISNNRAILDAPLNTDLSAFLKDWKCRCNTTEGVPALLENLITAI